MRRCLATAGERVSLGKHARMWRERERLAARPGLGQERSSGRIELALKVD
jgi:hypothetical protein